MTSVSVQELHDNLEAAEAASERGRVFITDGGEPRRVLIDIREYRELAVASARDVDAAKSMSLLDTFARSPFPEEYLDFEFPRMDFVLEPADLS